MTGRVRRALGLTAFAIAMGILESVVVLYLRELYYPGGFRFPIVRMPDRVAVAEVIREAATIVMLASVAALARRHRADGFFVFGFLFGVWDLVYYAGLRIFLSWPDSFGAWDILFLIPVPWLAPVIYPVVVSLLLIVGFLAHETAEAAGRSISPSRIGWAVAVGGASGVAASFCWRFRDVLDGRVPQGFPAALFWTALATAASPFVRGTLDALAGRRSREAAGPR
ncbi:MAG: hypothetical protein LAO51_02885 [Acidobacteriia bacterium]|nr:hypothetical protein [Terriglobia bacterium]